MKLLVVVVGRVRPPLAEAVAEYEGRAARYWKLEVVEVTAGASGRNASPERVRAAEAARLERAIPEGTERWVLTREGRALTSSGWARLLGSRAVQGTGDLAIVVGGAHGLEPSLASGARRRISLGPITLPHEMARLVLAEQLYRAGTILRNEPYHKGSE